MRLPKISLLSLLTGLLTPYATHASEPIRILRVGDSITRLTATDHTFAVRLAQAGLNVDFVGYQKPYPDEPGTDTDCEGYNGRPIEFFTRPQTSYGDERFSDNRVLTDAIPLKRALETYQPDIIVVMVGVNNMAGRSPEIPVADLAAKLGEFLDRLEEWMPPGARIVLSTIPPANEARDPDNPHRNQRHRLFSETVVRPAFEARVAAGKPYTLADPNSVLTPDDIKDSVHPTKAGKQKLNTVWAEAVLRALKR